MKYKKKKEFQTDFRDLGLISAKSIRRRLTFCKIEYNFQVYIHTGNKDLSKYIMLYKNKHEVFTVKEFKKSSNANNNNKSNNLNSA